MNPALEIPPGRAATGKAVVFGPYPPTPGPDAAATLASVRRLLEESAEVVVVSPVPSAAHHHADPAGTAGALRLARWVASAERVVLHLDPGVPLGKLDGPRLPLARRALGVALRRPGDVVVHLGAIRGAIDPRSVRAVLGPATRVVAASAGDRDQLVAAGLAPGRVEVAGAGVRPPARPARDPAGVDPAGADPGRWQLSDAPTREELQAEIRRRAALRADGEPPPPGGETTRRGTPDVRPLLAVPPLGPAPARSLRPGVGIVKRAVRKLVAWQIDPVIEHVNRLQRATLEAIEHQEDQESEPQDGGA